MKIYPDHHLVRVLRGKVNSCSIPLVWGENQESFKEKGHLSWVLKDT